MIVYKKESAWNMLNLFAANNWDKVGNLVKFCINHNLKDMFNEIAEIEFPNGCYEDEFEEWCCEDAEKTVMEWFDRFYGNED